MRPTDTPLPVINVDVASPCAMSWEAMTPDQGGRRYCAHCRRHVHDLSAMSRGEVVDLMCQNAGNLCVRYEQLPGGRVKTLEYAARRGEGLRTRRWLLAGVIVSLMGGVANAMWHGRKPPPAAPVVLGGIRPPAVIKGVSPPTQCP